MTESAVGVSGGTARRDANARSVLHPGSGSDVNGAVLAMHSHPTGALRRSLVPSSLATLWRSPRTLCACAGLALLVGLGLVLLRPTTAAPEPLRTRLVSDCDGSISDWLLSLPDQFSSFYEDTQADLVTKADPAVRFHVYYALDARRRSFEAALRRRGWRDPASIRWHKSARVATPWMRDLFLAAMTPAGAPVVLLHHRDRYRRSLPYWLITDVEFLAGTLDTGSYVATAARLEGGSVVVDGERVFANRGFVDEALIRGDAHSAQSVIAGFGKWWGRPVELISAGDAHVSGHCDLLMMPAGERRMVLASVALGARLLASVGSAERAGFEAAYDGITHRACEDHPLRGLEASDVLARMQRHGDRPELQRRYRAIRLRLEELGYECFEVPLLEMPAEGGGYPATLSHANVMIDQRGTGRTVYLPTYHLPTLDAYAAGVWRKLGYRVASIDCLAPALQGGAVHCLSHVFRGPHPVPAEPTGPLE